VVKALVRGPAGSIPTDQVLSAVGERRASPALGAAAARLME
jgi:hypothetical protein